MLRGAYLIPGLLLALGAPCAVQAQGVAKASASDASVADFYRGNTVYMVIGSASGGGFDTYARIVSRYMTKYLPGNPNFVPQNQPGAGGLTAGNRVVVTSPQDGTFVGAVHPTTIVSHILGEKTNNKPLEFAFLGSASANLEACFLRTDAPIKTFDELWDKEVVFGASTTSSSSREYAALLKNALGMKVRIVGGYTGSADIMLALERGEVQATCGSNLAGILASKPRWFSENLIKVMAYQGSTVLTNVKEAADARPAVSYARTPEQKKILELYDLQGPIGRPYVTGKKVPQERIAALQTAFMSSMQDPELVKELKAKGLDVGPISGPDLQKIVSAVYDAPPEVLSKLRVALGYD